MIKSVCGYCGVGCGLVIENNKLKGDKQTNNQGKLCPKGASSLELLELKNRLLNTKYRENTNKDFKHITYEKAISLIAEKLKNTPKNKIGFYLSGQLLTEDYYIANKFVKGFLGTNNIDTNSRTCMASAVVAYKKSIGADFVPLKIDDIYKSDLLIIVGANTAESHVVLHNHIKKAKKQGLKVVVIDPRETLSTKDADLYLPIKVGKDIDFFNLISKMIIEENLYDNNFVNTKLNGFDKLKENLSKLSKDELLQNSGIDKELFDRFWELYKNSNNIITAWTMGLNQSSQGVDKNLALINTHLLSGKIFKKGNGPFSLTGQPNAMGGREVGGLATMLGVHLGFDKQSIEKVSKFWQTNKIDNKAGLCATQMLEGDLDVLIIAHTDPIYHLPNREKNEKLISKIPFVVEINGFENTQTSKFAHLQIPAKIWGEKEGTQTNLDRTISKQNIIKKPPNDTIKADWEIFCDIAKSMGFYKEFSFASPKEVFDEYKEMTRLNNYMDIYKTSYEELEKKPFRWGEEIKEFLTPDKKGNLFYVRDKNLSEQPSSKYPFLLITGRTRDQWHSGTKTAHIKTLLKYKELTFCEINKEDALSLGLEDGDEIFVVSKRAKLKTKVKISNINKKTLFIPISDLNINYLTNDLLDRESFEPDYNHSAVTIIKI
jgi:ferredoxin-nitrate reductase